MSSSDITSLLGVPRLSKYLDQVGQEFNRAVSTNNSYIGEPIARLIKSPGKRLRSALLIAIVASQNKEIDESVIVACTAVELLHIGSLVHDDIIDKAATRRGIPTVNSVEGSDRAILVGDYLFAKACSQGAKVNAEVAEKIALTITELCDGQSLELADQYNLDRTQEEYFKSIQGKTAALIATVCQIAGICSGVSNSKMNSLARYGEKFGLSFQIIDDLLDLISSDELAGKPVGNDMKEGVYTLPIILALNGPHGEDIKAELNKKINTSTVVNILIAENSITKTVELAKQYNQEASKALDGFSKNSINSHLMKLPEAYLEWSLDNLVDASYKAAVSR